MARRGNPQGTGDGRPDAGRRWSPARAAFRRALRIPAVGIALLILAAGSAGRTAPEKRKDFVVVPASGPLAGRQVYRESHALLIGINEYAQLPKEQWLEYAANDVRALRETLTRDYGFPDENVTVLLNGQATRERIYRELARLADKRKVQAEDRILIYFSGHGQTVKLVSGGDMGFLIPHDADVDLNDPTNVGPFLASCVAMKSVWDYLESSPAKHVLVLADACYSGLLAKPRALAPTSPEVLAALAGRRAIQVVTAGRRGEVSYELSRYGHGAFTHKLLEELKAHASTPGAVFTATELYAWVKRGVAELSQGKQTPQMGDYDTEGDFLFITAGRLTPAVPPKPAVPVTSALLPPANAQPGQVWVCPTDGAEMVYVPAGKFIMGSEGGGFQGHPTVFDNEQPLHPVTLPAFWIDRYEVTAAQFARFLNETGTTRDAQGRAYFGVAPDLPIQQAGGRWAPRNGHERHPMVWVTWQGASAYAKWAGKRLPTEAEWEKAARGTDSRKYPWGSDPSSGKWANWGSSDPQRPFPVGSFPTDTSPYGCMDMAGNAWEWISSIEKPYPYRPDDGREDPDAPGKRVARGGGISVWPMGRTSYRASMDTVRNSASNVMGFRCARSEDDLPAFLDDPRLPVPRPGEVRINRKDGAEVVCVPAGEFPMGLDRQAVDEAIRKLQIEEKDRADTYQNIPGLFRVSTPGFWIYKHEVTFAQYARFLREAGRSGPRCSADDQPVFWPNGQPAPGRERQPVVCAPWADARAYAEWAGGRLPTEAEWEKAARGTDGRPYPWGNEWDATRCNTSERLAGKPLLNESACFAWFQTYVAKPSPVENGSLQPVGSHPTGASPYGCLDMAGNAWEWCSSLDAPYPYNAADGREEPSRPGKRIVRGGAWVGTARHALSPRRTAFPPGGAYGHIGFRCVIPEK